MPMELTKDLFVCEFSIYIVKVAHGKMWKEDKNLVLFLVQKIMELNWSTLFRES